MDISLTIYANPPSRDFNKRMSHTWHMPGDTIDVQMWHGETIGSPRFVFIHVMDLPEPRPVPVLLDRLKRMLLSQIKKIIPDKRRILVRTRKWRVVFSRLPQSMQNALQRDRNITITWDQLKIILRTKTVVDEFDPSADTDQVVIADGDL